MSVVYLDRRDLSVSVVDGRLRVEIPGEDQPRFMPLHTMEHLVAAADFALPTALIAALADRGIALTVLRHRHDVRGVTMLGRPQADVGLRLAQYRAAASPALALPVARATVLFKRAAQVRTLRSILRRRPDQRAELLRQLAAIGAVDPSAPATVNELRGTEGAISRAYYAGLRAALPPALGFRARLRRPPPDPVNAALSLAYTLLGGCAMEAAYAAGLDPMLGFLHAPARGRDSLACDLVEPLRPAVDRWIWRLFADGALRAESFRRDGGACLLGKTGRRAFYAGFEQRAPTWRRTLRGYAMRLRRHLEALGPTVPDGTAA